jgi:hypothetical protein
MLMLIKRLGARLLKRNMTSKRGRTPRPDPLLSGPVQPDPRLRGARGQPDPNAGFLGEQTGEGAGGGAGGG